MPVGLDPDPFAAMVDAGLLFLQNFRE